MFHNIMDTLPVRGWQVVRELDGLHLPSVDVQGPLVETQLGMSARQFFTVPGNRQFFGFVVTGRDDRL
jgi:hypothetical protein